MGEAPHVTKLMALTCVCFLYSVLSKREVTERATACRTADHPATLGLYQNTINRGNISSMGNA